MVLKCFRLTLHITMVASPHCKQFSPSELNIIRISSDFANHPVPELIAFYIKYMQRKSKGEHFADWSARSPDPSGRSVEIVAAQQGVIVNTSLTFVDNEYNLFIPKTCKDGDMDVYTRQLRNVFLFLDSFFPSTQ